MNFNVANNAMVDDTVKTAHNDTRMIFLVVIVVFLLIVIIVLIFHINYTNTKYVPIDNCPKTKGEFAVTPGKKGRFLRNCTSDPNCTFDANTVSVAIDTCLSNGARAFSYNSGKKSVSLIHETLDLTDDPTYDTYIFQD